MSDPLKAFIATVRHCVSHASLLLLENASVGLYTDHMHTLHVQLDMPRPAFISTGDYSAPSSFRFHLSKLSSSVKLQPQRTNSLRFLIPNLCNRLEHDRNLAREGTTLAHLWPKLSYLLKQIHRDIRLLCRPDA